MDTRGHELLTVKEAAAFLRVPVSFVYERTRKGEIPSRRGGRLVRIPRDQLEARERAAWAQMIAEDRAALKEP